VTKVAAGPAERPPRAPESVRRKRRLLFTGAASVALHGLMLLVVLSARPELPVPPLPEPMIVELVKPRPIAPPVVPTAEPQPQPAPPTPEKQPEPPRKPPPPRHVFRQSKLRPPPDVRVEAAGKGPSSDGEDELSDSQIAGAATADGGGAAPGGECNMVRWLQAALRKDQMVQSAVAAAHRGKAILVWNGQWVRHGSEEGAGLAAVRESIMWEVAFAPKACRDRPVRGMVLISLNDSPGAGRVVLGAGEWRWDDLLHARGANVPGGASFSQR
jgi:hypothetical protein